MLLAVYLSQHISWKHAFNWGWSDIGGQRKNCFDFVLANRITGKGVLHYTAFNAMLMVMLDRLALGVNELELDENLNLPSYYVPQGHITCKKCLALEEKSLLAKKFHAALNIGKPPLVQQASVSRTLSIRPVLRMSSKLNESASNLNKFSENESKVKADLSFNLSKKKFQDLDEMCKGMTELPQTSVQRIPLMPSDPSKKLLISSLRRSETDHDIGISRFMQNSALSNSGMKGMPPTPLKLSINHLPFPQRPIVIGGEQPHSSLSSSNNPLHSDRLTVNTVTANSQQAVHMLKRRKIKPDDASSQGSSYSSQALKTSAPLTNISPAKLVSRTNKDKIVANVTMVISRCLNTLSAGLAHLTTVLPTENPVTVTKHVHTSTGHLRQVLLALGLLERCLQSPFDLSTRGVCFVDFIDVLATAHKLTKAGLNWASEEEYKHRPAGEERPVVYIPNPSERRTAFLEMTAAGYGFPAHKDQPTKVTDQSVLTCRLAVRQIFTIFGVLIQCMAKMHSFESTFKNRIKNFLEELRLIVETSGKYPNCAFRSRFCLMQKVCWLILMGSSLLLVCTRNWWKTLRTKKIRLSG